jgi:hypothetical protein
MIPPAFNKTTSNVNNISWYRHAVARAGGAEAPVHPQYLSRPDGLDRGEEDRGHLENHWTGRERYYLLWRGSRASRRPSPMKLTESTHRAMATPGKMMACWPSTKTP